MKKSVKPLNSGEACIDSVLKIGRLNFTQVLTPNQQIESSDFDPAR